MARVTRSRSPANSHQEHSYKMRRVDNDDEFERGKERRRDVDNERGPRSRRDRDVDDNEPDPQDSRHRGSGNYRGHEHQRRRSRDRDYDGRNVDKERYHDRPVRDDGWERSRDKYGDSSEKRRRERSRSVEGERERGKRRNYDREYDSRRPKYDDRERESRPSSSRAGPSREPQGRSLAPVSDEEKDDEKEKDKGKPNFKNSGLLAADTNTVKRNDGTSTVLKYNEPPEARRTNIKWRLYAFKGKEESGVLLIHDQTCYLVGRDKAVCDIYIEHPSCSKQHAAIQYRQVTVKDEYGAPKPTVKPFIIDLESTNHTYVNDKEIPKSRYYELRLGDVIKFGMSNREYVLVHDDA